MNSEYKIIKEELLKNDMNSEYKIIKELLNDINKEYENIKKDFNNIFQDLKMHYSNNLFFNF